MQSSPSDSVARSAFHLEMHYFSLFALFFIICIWSFVVVFGCLVFNSLEVLSDK